MPIRAKFRCNNVELSEDGDGGTVELSPVINGSPENEQFYKYTPAGHLVLSTINPDALSQFHPGNDYYVDITPA